MLRNETRALKKILKRLERNKRRLEKQAERLDYIFYEVDKKMHEKLLTLNQ